MSIPSSTWHFWWEDENFNTPTPAPSLNLFKWGNDVFRWGDELTPKTSPVADAGDFALGWR